VCWHSQSVACSMHCALPRLPAVPPCPPSPCLGNPSGRLALQPCPPHLLAVATSIHASIRTGHAEKLVTSLFLGGLLVARRT
jgi:hypothetical protein